jgi:hypothetical protein
VLYKRSDLYQKRLGSKEDSSRQRPVISVEISIPHDEQNRTFDEGFFTSKGGTM